MRCGKKSVRRPFDVISASVTYDPTSNTFSLQITDTTTNTVYLTILQPVPTGAKESSAEWIAEAPSSIQGVLPLADFGTVYFTGCSATINGQTNSISNWQYNSLTMATGIGRHLTTIKSQPSRLSADGTSFSVTWYSS